MVPGFNHNVKRRGQAYHVQTEDLGLSNPVVVTHLFSGGNVVASSRTSYADLPQATDLERRVRELMEEQHKQMLRNLVNGAYDADVPPPSVDPVRTPAPADPVRATAAARPSPPPPPLPRTAVGSSRIAMTGAARHGSLDIGDDGLEQAILAYLAGEREE